MTEKKFPRYFVHADKFYDGTIYIVAYANGKASCISPGGKKDDAGKDLLQFAEDCVKNGDWKEISRTTAQRRLKKAQEGKLK